MANAEEFIKFWLENSVHADEQYGIRRGRFEIEKLAGQLLMAAEEQGFTKAQMEAEIGNVHDYIRNSIDRQNTEEQKRLGKPDK